MKAKTSARRLFGWFKYGLIGLTVIMFGLLGIGLIYQTAATEADQRNYPPPGHLIDVGGFKMHIYCQGEGSPTVILETLSGGTSSYWGWVQPEVAQTTRVCVYDRAGRGWSEPDPQSQSLERTVHNLHTLLTNANIQGPFILVGHSIGGIYMRQFAADYADEVAGIVLVDSAHPEQFVKYPEMLTENEEYLRLSAVFPLLARLGLFHFYFATGGEIDFAELSEPQRSEAKVSWSSPEYFESQRAEMLAGPGIFTQAQQLGGLGDLPLIVVSQGQGTSNDWVEMQNDLAALSTNSLHITVNTATHASLAFNPQDAQGTSAAILDVIYAVRSGQALQ